MIFTIKVIASKEKCCSADLQFVKFNLPTREETLTVALEDARRVHRVKESWVREKWAALEARSPCDWLCAGCNKELNTKNEPYCSGSYNYTEFQSWTYIEHINLKFTGEVGVKYRIWEFGAQELTP